MRSDLLTEWENEHPSYGHEKNMGEYQSSVLFELEVACGFCHRATRTRRNRRFRAGHSAHIHIHILILIVTVGDR